MKDIEAAVHAQLPKRTYGNALLLQNRGSSRYRLDTEK
jgi:hypothetical protein